MVFKILSGGPFILVGKKNAGEFLWVQKNGDTLGEAIISVLTFKYYMHKKVKSKDFDKKSIFSKPWVPCYKLTFLRFNQLQHTFKDNIPTIIEKEKDKIHWSDFHNDTLFIGTCPMEQFMITRSCYFNIYL